MQELKLEVSADRTLELVIVKLKTGDSKLEFGMYPNHAVSVATTILAQALPFLYPEQKDLR